MIIISLELHCRAGIIWNKVVWFSFLSVVVCTCWVVCHGVYLLGCVSWCALVGLYVCHGVYLLGCVSWRALVGLCVMVCSCWVVCHGVFLLGCVPWCWVVCHGVGLCVMACTCWVVCHGVYQARRKPKNNAKAKP